MLNRLSPNVATLSLSICASLGTPGTFAQDSTTEEIAALDWESIRAAYEAARHAAIETESGYRADNPRQTWRIAFDERCLRVRPYDGRWAWSLELVGYGFAGSLRESCSSIDLRAEGRRVSRIWDQVLEEWYVNEPHGLEHGFTVWERPPCGAAPGDSGPLVFTLRTEGGLRADIDKNLLGVRFTDERGATVLSYSGLAVFDSNGRTVEAWFEERADALCIVLDERDASYPLTIDPVAQQPDLVASNQDTFDQFGVSVAASGDTIVVGARGESSSASGVNGDQSDNSAPRSGAAYVFVRSGSTWIQQAYIKASNPDPEDHFGHSVALSGDTLVVGAYEEDSNATGVDGDQADNSAHHAGAVYVFTRDGSTWSQQAYLKPLDSVLVAYFGWSVAVSDDRLIVGAKWESSISGASGAAYVFVRNDSTWSQEAHLKAFLPGQGDEFGHSVGIDGDTAVVGAWHEASAATGVDGDESDNSAPWAGAAYAFARNGTSWSQQAYLKGSNTDTYHEFGVSVGVSGDTVVVGAQGESAAEGAAYAFVRGGTTWTQEAYIKASNADPTDYFGSSVSISDETLIVGAIAEDGGATGVDGDQTSNSTLDAGAAYVFERTGSTWIQDGYLKPSANAPSAWFGYSVAVQGDTLVVGKLHNRAYPFEIIPRPVGTASCYGNTCRCGNDDPAAGCANSTGSGGLLDGTGSASVVADDLLLGATGLPPSNNGLFYMGDTQVQAPFFDGFQCALGNTFRFLNSIQSTGAGGTMSLGPGIVTDSGGLITAGSTWHFHAWHRDVPGSPCGTGANLTNLYSVTFTP